MSFTRQIDYVFRFSHSDDNVPVALQNPVLSRKQVLRGVTVVG